MDFWCHASALFALSWARARLVLFFTPRLEPCVHGWPSVDPWSVGLGALTPLRAQ